MKKTKGVKWDVRYMILHKHLRERILIVGYSEMYLFDINFVGDLICVQILILFFQMSSALPSLVVSSRGHNWFETFLKIA
jgi:hypothetical protein